jgi:ferredoxin
MKIRTDVEACVGAGQCVLLAPDVFDVSDDGKVVVLVEQPTGDRIVDVRNAVVACPAFAIEVED